MLGAQQETDKYVPITSRLLVSPQCKSQSAAGSEAKAADGRWHAGCGAVIPSAELA